MNRRAYILAAGTLSVTALAGCLADDGDDTDTSDDTPSDDDSDGTGDGETPNENGESGADDSPDEHEALAVVDDYFEAADDHDLEAMADAMHSYHPFDPDRVDEDGEESFSVDPIDIERYEREIVDDDFDTDTIREDPNIEFWFQETETTLDEILDGEAAALVRTTYEATEGGEAVEETEQFILLTEDGEWKVFFPYEEPPEVPDADPVDDEDYHIVDDIEYDGEIQMATVHLSGAGDVEAEELVVYSTSLREDSSVWSEESETLPAVQTFAAAFDPDGDELVVTLVFADDEVVIHRDEYEP